MKYIEFKCRLSQAGLNAKQFAHLMQMHPNSLSNYAKDNLVPSHLGVIVSLCVKLKENEIEFEKIFKNLNLSKKSARGSASVGVFGGSRQQPIDFKKEQ